MFLGVRSKLRAFGPATRGNVRYLWALLIVPLAVLAVAAVDLGRLQLTKNQLGTAVSAAAANVSANPNLTQDQAKALVKDYVDINFSTQNPSIAISQVDVTLQTEGTSPCPQAPAVFVTATLTMNTEFLKAIGYGTLSATVSACVTGTKG